MAISPPPNSPISEPNSGKVNSVWFRWFMDLYTRTGGGATSTAPSNATYITQTTNSTLTNEQALSLLSSGVVKVTTGSGVLSSVTPLPVADGGTGASSITAYAVVCGGTTSTAALQPVASVGTSGQLLTSNGAGTLPTFQTLTVPNSFTNIAVSGQSDCVADTTSDTLTLATDGTMSFTTNAGTDTVTLSNTTLATQAGVQKNTYTYFSSTYSNVGSVNRYSVTASPAITSYTTGLELIVGITSDYAANNPVININSVGDANLKLYNGSNLSLATNQPGFKIFNGASSVAPIIVRIRYRENFGDGNVGFYIQDYIPSFVAVSENASGTRLYARRTHDEIRLNAGNNITLTATVNGPGDLQTMAIACTDANIFKTIAVSGQSDIVADSATDTLTVASGSGITLTTNASTDTLTITNSGALLSFSTISVSGQSDVVADSTADTLTLAAGSGITLTTNASTDTITVTNAGYYSGGTDVAVADGGTGSSTAAGARSNLGAAASGANTDITSVYLDNTGLKVKDTNASHGLTIKPGSDLTADRILTITTGDVARTLTLGGNATLNGGVVESGIHSGTNTGDQNVFTTIAVSGQNNVVTDTASDTLTLASSGGGAITTDDSSDTITFHSSVAQIVYTKYTGNGSGTTIMPADDTIPQNTEGDEYFTRAITPKRSNNILKIDVIIQAQCSIIEHISAAIFQDSTADALAAAAIYPTASAKIQQLNFTHFMTAGTTSETTFKVRVGSETGNTIFLNYSGAALFSTLDGCYIIITEFYSP